MPPARELLLCELPRRGDADLSRGLVTAEPPGTQRERFLQDLNQIVKALGKLQANGAGKAD